MTGRWTRREFCAAVGALGAGYRLGAAAPNSAALPFKLGVITDEISPDLDVALEFIASYRLSYCELRSVGGKNIMSMSQTELERAKQIIDKHSFHVSDIASPIYKWDLGELPAVPSHERDTSKLGFKEEDAEELLKKSFKIARLFGTKKVRIFGYWRVEDPGKAYPRIVETLKRATALAEQNKIVLLLENESSCNVATGKECARVLREINSPWLRGNWDPDNAADLNEVPFPDGYNHMRGLFQHMHIKDSARDAATGKFHYVPVGKGVVDYQGQFRALLADGYSSTISLETHYLRADGNKMESTRECMEGLMKILNSTTRAST